MKIAIVGGGAAGLFCAANLPSNDVTIFEATNSCGNKLLLTGGGRCNYTNLSANFFDGIVDGQKFLRSSISSFGPNELIKWFKGHGLGSHTEGTRAFPITQSSKSVLALLAKLCKQNNVKFSFGCRVESINLKEYGKYEILGQEFDAVVVATGGKTFAKTGSDGSGNKLLNQLGIRTNEFSAKLGALYLKGTSELQGVSLTAGLSAISNNKVTAKVCGSVVFTHFGLSGPAALDLSALADCCDAVQVDFLPNKTAEELKNALAEARNCGTKQKVGTFFSQFLPKSVARFVSKEVSDKFVNELSNKQINLLLDFVKNHKFEFLHFSSFNQSWVSAGGAILNQINPTNMQTKAHKNLFVIGEQLDVFGLCGGYNLQIAFSTAKAAADYLEGVAK